LPEDNIETVSEFGSHSFLLAPLHLDPYRVVGTRVVVVETADGGPYYISFRDRSGADRRLDPEYQYSTTIHQQIPDSFNSPVLVDTFRGRGRFQDPENGLTVEGSQISVEGLRGPRIILGVRLE
jgi:hypothetical protein